VPAKNIQINRGGEFKGSLWCDATSVNKERWLSCFKPETKILYLRNGERDSCSFGTSQGEDAGFWKYGATFDIELTYEGWFGRKFKEKQQLRIQDSNSFTGFHWGEPTKA